MAAGKADGPDSGGSRRDTVTPAGTGVSVFRYHRTDPAPRGPGNRAEMPRDPMRATLVTPRIDPARIWDALNPLPADDRHGSRAHLVAARPGDPAAAAFDVLRTQLVQAAAENGWRRIAVTSPTAGCGKNFVLANLALALSRRPDFRTVVVDLDLRSPSLAALFGVADAGRLADVLSGEQPVEAMFHRVGRSLALGLNDRPEAGSAEILQDPRTAETIAAIERALMPDLTLFDLPPLLDGDDALGFLPRVDGVLLVADGTRTLAREMTAAERLLKDRTVFVGVVLNRAESTAVGR
jgi:Mrp family chromosome partitioning ATPase